MRTFLVAALTFALAPAARADSDPPSPDVPDTTPAPAEAPAADATAPAPAPAPAVAPPAMTPVVTPAPMALAPPPDRTNAYIATGITSAALLGAIYCLVKFDQTSDAAGKSEPGRLGTDAEARLRAAYDDADSWRTRTLVMGGVVLVGAVVSGYFWGETDPKPRLNVHPTSDGAAVSLSGRF